MKTNSKNEKFGGCPSGLLVYAIFLLKKSHRITFFEALEHIDSAALQVQRC